MTAILDAARPAAGAAPAPRRSGRASTWRFSLRLARREVRRRPGRTLLVMLLVALPVCGMTMITVLVRTNNDSGAESFAREFGRADLVADTGLPTGTFFPIKGGHITIGPGAVARAVGRGSQTLPTATFPPGTRVVKTHDFLSGFTGLVSSTGVARLAHATDLDLNDPIAHGIVLLRSGRYPTRAGEALLSPSLARAFNVHIGDTLHLQDPAWTEKVVGIGALATNWNDGLIAVRGNELSNTGGQGIGRLELVDLPGHPTDAQLRAYSNNFQTRLDGVSGRATTKVNWILVAGIIALAIVGIVISGAFAVGARRQLVTLGQLSSNGADEHLLRRTLSLQGLLSGAIGSVVGFTVGVVALLTLQHRFADLMHHDPGPLVWSARDAIAILITGIVTATVAAFIPARSAARVPVLAALAGRRPLGRIPKSLVPTGIALFAGGVFVLALVAAASVNNNGNGGGNGSALAASAVFAGVLVLSGACCASSAVVAALAGVARRARGAMRVAVRSVVRSRARSAAVVMALAAMNAGAIAIATGIDSHTGANAETPSMPKDTLILSSAGDFSGPLRQFLPPSASELAALHKILPDATYTVRRAVVGSAQDAGGPRDFGEKAGNAPGGSNLYVPPIATVTDPEVLRMLGMSARDKAALERYGVMSVSPVFDNNNHLAQTAQVELGSPPQVITAAVAHDPMRAIGDADGFYITEAKAHALGLPIENAGVIVRNPTPFTDSQKASLLVQQSLFLNNAATQSAYIAWEGASNSGVSPAIAREIILGIVLFLTLCVLAMSLALSAAETRDERDILVSLGAKPATMRSVAAWKSGALAACGALLAIPTGFIPVWVVFHAVARVNEHAHVAFPWSTVGQLLIVAPIIAGLVAYVGSAVAQAVKPTKMSTFALD
jgi:putative ABC transport system permease protein